MAKNDALFSTEEYKEYKKLTEELANLVNPYVHNGSLEEVIAAAIVSMECRKRLDNAYWACYDGYLSIEQFATTMNDIKNDVGGDKFHNRTMQKATEINVDNIFSSNNLR